MASPSVAQLAAHLDVARRLALVPLFVASAARHGVPLPVLSRVRLYVCGITPYDTTHVGHAATFVWVDTLARVLEHVGVDVQVCRNVTDVDDDLLRAATERGVTWNALATQQTLRIRDEAGIQRRSREARGDAARRWRVVRDDHRRPVVRKGQLLIEPVGVAIEQRTRIAPCQTCLHTAGMLHAPVLP